MVRSWAGIPLLIAKMSSSAILDLRKKMDARSGGKVPAVVETPSLGLVIPNTMPVEYQGNDAIAEIPKHSAWNCGYLALPINLLRSFECSQMTFVVQY